MKSISVERRKAIQSFKNKVIARELGVSVSVLINAKINANQEAIRKFGLE